MPIHNLRVGLVTRDVSDAGTNSAIEIVINDNGVDVLTRRLGHPHPRRGQANLYTMDLADIVGHLNSRVIPEHLNHSSIRVGIRGSDRWAPQLIFVWGERDVAFDPDENAALTKVPIALETDIETSLSTDENEGALSIPIRMLTTSDPTVPIHELLALMTTERWRGHDTGTHDRIGLRINGIQITFPDTPQSDQEYGAANIYRTDVRANHWFPDQIETIQLNIDGPDAWLPGSFFLFGLHVLEGHSRPSYAVPLVYEPRWDAGWLSTDPDDRDAHESVALNLVQD